MIACALCARRTSPFQDTVYRGLAFVAILSLSDRPSSSVRPISNLARSAIVCVAALGMTIVIVAGGIDLSVVVIASAQSYAQLFATDRGARGAAARSRQALCGLMNGSSSPAARRAFIITLGTMLCARRCQRAGDERRLEAPLTG